MSVKPVGKLAMQWQVVDGMTTLTRRNLRPLYLSLDLTSMVRDSPWVKALNWLRVVFMVRKMNLRFKHFLTMNGCVNNALMMDLRARCGHKMLSSTTF